MLIFTNLRGLGAFLAMETKERAILLVEGDRNSENAGAVLILCFLPVRSRAGVPGGEVLGLTFEVLTMVLGAIMIFAACKSLGFEL